MKCQGGEAKLWSGVARVLNAASHPWFDLYENRLRPANSNVTFQANFEP